MLFWLALACIVLAVLVWGQRWLVRASPSDLQQAACSFAAVFTALASTGLIFTGRWGLALVTMGAAAVALRSLWRSGRGADPIGDQGGGEGSDVRTRLLAMRLDHASGELDGEVLMGPCARSSLSALALAQLLDLLALAQRDDPPSVTLLEAYLDRCRRGWRENAAGDPGAAPAGRGAMDAATALQVLGLAAGATPEEIRAAHRRLMAGLHPDHGGSGWLASQVNQARDVLLRGGT